MSLVVHAVLGSDAAHLPICWICHRAFVEPTIYRERIPGKKAHIACDEAAAAAGTHAPTPEELADLFRPEDRA